MKVDLTQREIRALGEAIGFRLAGETEEDTDTEALHSAQDKLSDKMREPKDVRPKTLGG